MILKAIGDFAGVRAGVRFETVDDSVFVESIMQLACIHAETVLVTHIDRDRAVSSKISDVLIDESKRRIGGPLGNDLRLRLAILHR